MGFVRTLVLKADQFYIIFKAKYINTKKMQIFFRWLWLRLRLQFRMQIHHRQNYRKQFVRKNHPIKSPSSREHEMYLRGNNFSFMHGLSLNWSTLSDHIIHFLGYASRRLNLCIFLKLV